MGNQAKPVNLWRWSSGTTEKPPSAVLVDASGIENQQERDTNAGLAARANYKTGTWQVVMTRALKTKTADKDLQFEEGRFVPIAFFAWDGSNSEIGTAHAMTTWYWLLLKPAPSSRPLLIAILAGLLIGGLLIWWGRSAARRNEKASSS